jgi:hypothetical protein
MRLDQRQVRFVVPFWPSLAHKVRLGGQRGSLNLQETALVVEGELIRFSFFGIEWLFRRALSEWTTVTVPYSRIVAVRHVRLWLLRIGSVVLTALVWALAVSLWRAEPLMAGVAVVLGFVGTVLVGFINFLVRSYHRVTYRGKDGRRRLLTFAVRTKRLRKPFLDTLAAHRAAAAAYMSPTAAGG